MAPLKNHNIEKNSQKDDPLTVEDFFERHNHEQGIKYKIPKLKPGKNDQKVKEAQEKKNMAFEEFK